MGKEFVSAAARWMEFQEIDFRPVPVAVSTRTESSAAWFSENVSGIEYTTTDYQELLEDDSIEVIYCAVPHNLHEKIYCDTIRSGKHLLGEKPFGIDQQASKEINKALEEHPEVFARISSQWSYYPGAYQIYNWLREDIFGKIIQVDVGFLHCSDLNPQKPINWKRVVDINGEYGCMGDLGPHLFHIPLRIGWFPDNLRALLSNIITERPDGNRNMVPCDTWDNAHISAEISTDNQSFPMTITTKRIDPGETNTWFLHVYGTRFSAKYSTKNPKELRFMPYSPGEEQFWRVVDVPAESAYPTTSGSITEFNMSDALFQMLAAFCDELLHGEDMRQPFHCMTPEEGAEVHAIFTGALESQATGRTIRLKS